MKQFTLPGFKKFKNEFGGQLLIGKRKSARPLSIKKPIHLVLRTNGYRIFHPHNRSLKNLINVQAKKFHIKIYDQAFNWNHAHFVIKIKSREDYRAFIRSLTSILSKKAQLAFKDSVQKLFTLRPYTKIIEWGRHFKNVIHYQLLNRLESAGIKRVFGRKIILNINTG